MKVFILLALASMAVATPLVQPVTLPEPAQPAMEDMNVPYPEPVLIQPRLIPEEILEALRNAEMPSDAEAVYEALRVINRMENFVAPDVPVGVENVVNVVDYVDYDLEVVDEIAAPADQEIPAEPVKIVDFAENVEYEPYNANDVVEEAAPTAEELPVEPVVLPSFARQMAALADQVIPAEAVKVVEIAEPQVEEVAAAAVEEIVPTPVKVVDFAPVPAPVQDVQEAVRVVDSLPQFPGKLHENPMWR